MVTDRDDTLAADREWLVNQIAHALRNPIFAASVQAEALHLRAGDPAAVIATAETLHAQLERLSRSIDEMLLFGRPFRPSLTTVTVDQLLHGVATRYRTGDRQEPAAVDYADVDPSITARWDETAVTIILERVLDNAVQHTSPPHNIAIRAVVREPDLVDISVIDDGGGISESVLDKALLPFFPQHSGRPGLGLAIADKLVGALGGTLTIDSREGSGTTVQITLPRIVDD